MSSDTPTLTVAAAAVHASKIYGKGDSEVRALDDVTVEFHDGEFTAIMGPSGSGKSTLMHCIAGLDELTSGSVLIAGTDLSTLSDKELTILRRDQVGFIFQSFNLVPTLNAYENITLPLALGGKKPNRDWVDKVVATVGLGDRLKHRPSELSGGQQQRVAVARALANEPHIIFADEPTGNLDPATGEGIMQLLDAINRSGTTVVMATHDHRMVNLMRKRVIQLDRGVMVRDQERGVYE